MREQVIREIENNKIIVIVRNVKREQLIDLAQAMYDGGIRLLEITYSAKGDVSDEETAQNIQILAERFRDRMFIGAGTVLNEKQVELTYKAGGQFVISPDTCPEVICKTRSFNMASIPGSLTPTEMQIAYKNGADFVKIFPITDLGTGYLKAVKAPLSHLKFLAVGGIDENNIRDYLEAGACGVGIGSNIVDKELLKNNDYAAIMSLAKKYVFAATRKAEM